MTRSEFAKLGAEAQNEALADLGYSPEEIEGAANAKARQDLFNAKVPAQETVKPQAPKASAPAKSENAPAKRGSSDFVVAPRAPRIKHNGGVYLPGDTIEVDDPAELDHLVNKGYVVSVAEIHAKGEYQAFDEAVKRQGYQVRSGTEVETPTKEGRLDDDGESEEIDAPKKPGKGRRGRRAQ